MSRVLRNPPKGPHIQINISAWNKDSHGLYDYQAGPDAYRLQTVYAKNSCKVYRDNNRFQVFFDQRNKMSDTPHPMVAELFISKSKTNPQYIIKKPVVKEEIKDEVLLQARTPYLVIRDYNKTGEVNEFPLKPGHVIKLGRVEYLVIQNKTNEETFTLRDTNHFEETTGIFDVNQHKKETQEPFQEGEKHCKVCLCDQQTQQDPLISPCNCRGSCRLIHVGCLKTWINSKVKKQLKGVAISYNFTKFQCQICKFPFPKLVRLNNTLIQMMTINKPTQPYIILQSLNNKQEINKQERCLHLISTQEGKTIKIGRGHDCEIRITDISVSRKHAEMFLRDGEFYIKDTKAKFGTLIKIQEDLALVGGKPIKVQCGRSVFQFKAMPVNQEVDTQ